MPRVGKPVSYGPNWLQRRQSGIPDPLGTRTHQAPFFYDGLNVKTLYSAPNENGIFCVEFNPEGSLLAAACENRNLLLFDTLDPRPVRDIENAHRDCINGIKFLDSRIFATCSDDYTVALWDLRNLKHRQSQLMAHTNWVKSIDYVPMSRTLVTSGFDGAIISWNLLEPGPDSVKIYPNELFNMNGLMRTRLSPDSQKLIISTTAGYLIVVHNLDLEEIKNDLKHFKPNMCRLIQLSQECLMPLSESIDLFRTPGKRNRVEFITDFPEKNDAEVIPSIQVHPEGHSVLSRNISHNETSEWTCVHSIEEIEDDDNAIKQPWRLPGYVHKSVKASRMISVLQEASTSDLTCNPTDVWEAMLAIEDARTLRAYDPPPPQLDFALSTLTLQRPRNGRVFRRMRPLRFGYEDNESYRHMLEIALASGNNEIPWTRHTRPMERERERDVVVPLSVFRTNGDGGNSLHRQTVAELRIQSGGGYSSDESDSDCEGGDDDVEENAASSESSSARTSTSGPSTSSRTRSPIRSRRGKVRNDVVHENIQRLNYFIEEPNVAPGFIKEPCFSADGRIICSPYMMGIRLLSFSPDLLLPWQNLPDPPPAQLHCRWMREFAASGSDSIVSTRFSPMDNQIVAGSRLGELFLISPFR